MRVWSRLVRHQSVHPSVALALSLSVMACSKTTSSPPDTAPPDGLTIWIPDASPTPRDVRDAGPNLCGNGVQDPGEECDDGNTQYGDGCSYCWVDPGWICARFGQPCIMPGHVCGNGYLSPDEACDDGNTTGGDGCSDDCKQVEPGWRCRVPGKPCLKTCGQDAGDCADGGAAAACGNGIVEPGEECDDGNDPAKTPHNGDGSYGGCTSACTWGAYCGDGVINGAETCDDGPNSVDLYGQPGCTFLCTRAHYCGDGVVDVDQGEWCDFGPDNGKGPCPVCDRWCKSIQCLP